MDHILTACDVCTTYRHSQRFAFFLLKLKCLYTLMTNQMLYLPTFFCTGPQAVDFNLML